MHVHVHITAHARSKRWAGQLFRAVFINFPLHLLYSVRYLYYIYRGVYYIPRGIYLSWYLLYPVRYLYISRGIYYAPCGIYISRAVFIISRAVFVYLPQYLLYLARYLYISRGIYISPAVFIYLPGAYANRSVLNNFETDGAPYLNGAKTASDS